MELIVDRFTLNYPDILRQLGIDGSLNVLELLIAVKMEDLPQGMNSRIGTASCRNRYFCLAQFEQSVLNCLLDRSALRLDLPAVKISAVVAYLCLISHLTYTHNSIMPTRIRFDTMITT